MVLPPATKSLHMWFPLPERIFLCLSPPHTFTWKAYSSFTYYLKHLWLWEAFLGTCVQLLLPVTCSSAATVSLLQTSVHRL